MNTKPFHCTKTTAFFWLVGWLTAASVCLAMDAFVIPRPSPKIATSTLIIIIPGLISMTYLLMLQIAAQQSQIADLKRELEEGKKK